MFAVLICTSLWGFFWIQFLTGVMYELPPLYSLSGGNSYFPAVEFYLENDGPFPWSLAGTFVAFSVFASLLGLLGGWLWTNGVCGKWRMRFAILVFSVIVCGWSIAALKAEEGGWIWVENAIDKTRADWRMAAEWGEDEWHLQYYREEVERLERLLESRSAD